MTRSSPDPDVETIAISVRASAATVTIERTGRPSERVTLARASGETSRACLARAVAHVRALVGVGPDDARWTAARRAGYGRAGVEAFRLWRADGEADPADDTAPGIFPRKGREEAIN